MDIRRNYLMAGKYYAEARTKEGRVFSCGTFSKLFEIRCWASRLYAHSIDVYLNNADGTLTRYQTWTSGTFWKGSAYNE